MKKVLPILLVFLLLSLCACGREEKPVQSNEKTEITQATETTKATEATDESNVLVAYFSATGNTKVIASYVGEITGGKLYEITPKDKYTEDDLKYYTDCRADREQNDPNCRPEIYGQVDNIEQYDVIYIGYPIWHGQAPKIIYTFLESYDLSGKKIIPFCTSASSPVGSSAENLTPCAPDARWFDAVRFAADTAKEDVEAWIKEIGIN